jgi:hypothetical protein
MTAVTPLAAVCQSGGAEAAGRIVGRVLAPFFRPSGVILALAGVLTTVLAVVAVVAPTNTAVAYALGAISVLLFVAAAIRITRETQATTIRDLELDAHALAGQIRALYAGNGLTDYQNVIARYRQRYAKRVRRIATRFRKQRVPQTDVLFRLAESGAEDFTEVFNIAEGLDRLADQLHRD